ncbi:MAG: Asp-tRNA(Asn)/Glu-tRNA(Gln) amidotransferase subunit GatB [Gammaproteobacteria bacterium]|nr:Asp-tRNA(Asn)/Glu-tRNA(Gln) amidotransferase subunit GatB [Gammaproteobacteria bacterium]
MSWETVIGLEIHAQLATMSKIFSGASTAFGAEPNTQACAVDLGLPGVLPVVNAGVVKLAVRFALATDAEITECSQFARKNYFYPDLPKGYQISQMALPIVGQGHVTVVLPDESSKRINITRAHLEEDAGKSVHDLFSDKTGIDLNRAGTPLLEIVSEPDMRSAAEAVAYAKHIHALVRYIDICDGNMQEGSFRCDANVSIRPTGTEELGTRTEVKNVNSFRFLERAIEFEVERQIDVLEGGGDVVQETRLYDADKDETRSMRSKEEANDYRYFPEPDLPPLVVDKEFIDTVRRDMPELPRARFERFIAEFELPTADAAALTADRSTADFFEKVIADQTFKPKLASNWILGELFARLNKEDKSLSESPVDADQFSALLARVDDNTISGKIGKQVFDELWSSNRSVDDIIDAKGLRQITDTSAIEAMIDEVIAANPSQAEEYRGGKEKLLGFFVGQVMKASQGKANPATLNDILKKKLNS